MACGIYRITNLANGRSYIGSSKDIEARWKNHLSTLRLRSHHNAEMQSDFAAHGEDGFSWEIVCEAMPEDLAALEMAAIAENRVGYNSAQIVTRGRTAKRPNRCPIMFSDAELAKLDRLALSEGVSRSEYLRKLVARADG